MFPFVFEWTWDTAHMVFHGGLWYALSILGLGMGYCILKSLYDTFSSGDAGHADHH
ncbi:MAG: hypothetical protein SWH68_02940 [Thermodesulfobacteriota bacterium]|nr:hypothetical protein [Thermodesulfobacteriota bacterium]